MQTNSITMKVSPAIRIFEPLAVMFCEEIHVLLGKSVMPELQVEQTVAEVQLTHP